MRKQAPAGVGSRESVPPCRRTSSAEIASPSPAPPARPELLEGREEVGRAPAPGCRARCRTHGSSPSLPSRRAVIADSRRPVARSGLAQRLHGVAHEVDEHARELVRVGVDLEVRRRLRDSQRDPGARRRARSDRAARSTSGREQHAAALRQALGGAAIGERRLAEARSPARASRRAAAPPAAPPDRRCPRGGRSGAAPSSACCAVRG